MPEFNLPESLDGLTSEELQGLHDAALAEFNTLNESDDLSPATLDRMAVLADAIDALRAQRTALAEGAERRTAMAARVTASTAETPPPPEPEPEAEVEAEPDAEAEPEIDAEPQPEAVTASVEVVPATSNSASGGTIVVTTPSTRIPESIRPALVITAAADIPQITSGSNLDLNELSRAIHLRARTLADHSGYVPVATAEKQFEPGYDLVDLTRHEIYEAIMDNSGATSLVASGGWCAPSEQLYGFFDIECARGSVLTLPTFRATRGGVTWPISSPLPAVNTTDWIHTEEDDIAGYEKPCITIPCPEWDECRLAAHGICVTAGNLMDRAFPENIRRYLNQVFIAHERNENLRKIQALIDGSTAVTFAASFGAASSIINAVLLAAATYRDKYRMCCGAMLEAVFPCWVREVMRGDLARQEGALTGGGGLPTDSEISAWFRDSGISPQFVNDWQTLGGNLATVDWNATVDFLLYAPGTWVEFNGGTLDLGVVRDSVLNSTNDFTAAWMEEFWCIGMKGYESAVVTVPICPSGEVGDRADMDCSVS
jgi:hypothetical protein